MLTDWEVERALAWRRRASKVASKARLLGAPGFTSKVASEKLAKANAYRTSGVSRKLPAHETGSLFPESEVYSTESHGRGEYGRSWIKTR